MTNVHAMIHKPTDADPLDQAIPLVELCIHGHGEKYGRGLAVASDSLPSVQNLKLVLAECYEGTDNDEERSDTDDDDSNNSAYVTADSQNVINAEVHSADVDSAPCPPPVVDVLDIRELSSGCLKRPSCTKKSPAKKQKTSANDSADGTTTEDAAAADDGNHPSAGNDAVVVRSLCSTSDGSQSTGSSSMDGGTGRCLLNTSTGMSQWKFID